MTNYTVFGNILGVGLPTTFKQFDSIQIRHSSDKPRATINPILQHVRPDNSQLNFISTIPPDQKVVSAWQIGFLDISAKDHEEAIKKVINLHLPIFLSSYHYATGSNVTIEIEAATDGQSEPWTASSSSATFRSESPRELHKEEVDKLDQSISLFRQDSSLLLSSQLLEQAEYRKLMSADMDIHLLSSALDAYRSIEATINKVAKEGKIKNADPEQSESALRALRQLETGLSRATKTRRKFDLIEQAAKSIYNEIQKNTFTVKLDYITKHFSLTDEESTDIKKVRMFRNSWLAHPAQIPKDIKEQTDLILSTARLLLNKYICSKIS